MANTLTSTSSLPWIWVVEALARSNEVDASLLIDLVKRIPEISDDLGKSAREVLSFRILENLLTKKNWNKDDTSLGAGDKIRFDLSESCEDVLQKIVQELSASNTKMSGPLVLKWDIQSFVTYKRSTLPQCALLQLKDIIVKGTDPQLATLKERSGLPTSNQSGNVTSVDGIAFNGTKEMWEESNVKHLAQNENMVASSQDNRDLLLTKKRKRISADHCSINEMPKVKSAAEEENSNAELRNSNNARHPLVQQVSCANESERNFMHTLSNGGPTNETKDNIDCFHGPDPCNDGDKYHEERVEIASKKTAFLSSQCTYSQDSFATTDLREINLCLKCNRGGKLLVCSSETCPLVVHDSCLGSIPNFEKDGKFYCPFCAYSRAISKYMEVKKKALLARKDLATFGLGIEQPLKNVSTSSSRSETNQSRQDEELSENGEANIRNSLRDMSSQECRANTEDKQKNPSV